MDPLLLRPVHFPSDLGIQSPAVLTPAMVGSSVRYMGSSKMVRSTENTHLDIYTITFPNGLNEPLLLNYIYNGNDY